MFTLATCPVRALNRIPNLPRSLAALDCVFSEHAAANPMTRPASLTAFPITSMSAGLPFASGTITKQHKNITPPLKRCLQDRARMFIGLPPSTATAQIFPKSVLIARA
jgi:hypothetical protein